MLQLCAQGYGPVIGQHVDSVWSVLSNCLYENSASLLEPSLACFKAVILSMREIGIFSSHSCYFCFLPKLLCFSSSFSSATDLVFRCFSSSFSLDRLAVCTESFSHQLL
jgi:hypothetical protein